MKINERPEEEVEGLDSILPDEDAGGDPEVEDEDEDFETEDEDNEDFDDEESDDEIDEDEEK
jgi:hypothetical protein